MQSMCPSFPLAGTRGLFSLTRAYADAILPEGKVYTFWGKGVSQGHSDAIRRVPGVKNAIQYTIPVAEAVEEVRSGIQPDLDQHVRSIYGNALS